MSKKRRLLEKSSRQLCQLACLLAMLSACMSPPPPRLSAHDITDIQSVETYLNDMPRFVAHFTQSGAFGPGAGLLWLDRPGHLRIDYAGPTARLMVISSGRVRVLDRATGALTTMPLSRTPLGILLADHITLTGPVTVTSLSHTGDTLQLTLQKTSAPAQGSLTLTLTTHPLALAQVTVVNPAQQSLTMALSDIDTNPKLTADLFAAPGS